MNKNNFKMRRIILGKKQGKKIVLTASESEMCDFGDNPFYAFYGAFPDQLTPRFISKWLVNFNYK